MEFIAENYPYAYIVGWFLLGALVVGTAVREFTGPHQGKHWTETRREEFKDSVPVLIWIGCLIFCLILIQSAPH